MKRTETIQPDETMVALAAKMDDLQSASNLYAITVWFANTVLPEVRKRTNGSDDLEAHPFVRAFASKLVDMCNLNGHAESGEPLEGQAINAVMELRDGRPATYEV